VPGGPLNKVTKGARLAIPAEAYNSFVDAAVAHRERGRIGGNPLVATPGSGVVRVRNDSGLDRGRFDILSPESAPLAPLTPSVAIEEFLRVIVLGAVTPTLAHSGRALVLLEPIAANRVGLALADGVTHARVRMIDDRDRGADVDAADPTVLRSCSDGPAQLLWVQPRAERENPTIAWVICRLGVSAERTMRAVLTSAEEFAPNRWRYSWMEARWQGAAAGWAPVLGAYTHTDWGYAYIGFENANRATGVQGSGIDEDTLPDGFDHQPLGPGAAPLLHGPVYAADGTPAWIFDGVNNVDGECQP